MNLFIAGIIEFLAKAGYYVQVDQILVNTKTCTCGKSWLGIRRTQ